MTRGEGGARPPLIRCAIYTRKSSDEGLEQSFNSLDAQREACAAYILSQRHEGWTLLPDIYDDGGYSGGTMQRPAILSLMEAVKARQVDVIVVYKVDRLTRSLADFAKMVDVLDHAKASFVSITQAFNTTTSMGRLTLNVLLSFAQFEREVTGERIRDKIAASKKKGIWMGGPVPLGYDVRDRKLIINPSEAKTVRHIFERYAAIGAVDVLVGELARSGIRTKASVLRSGHKRGGTLFRRGTLRHMLSNRIYRGEIGHKGSYYPAEHEALIDQPLWDKVQAVRAQLQPHCGQGRRERSVSLLSGLIVDHLGRPLYATHAVKAGKRYRYYVTHPNKVIDSGQPAVRMPAHDLERAVTQEVQSFLSDDCRVSDTARFDGAAIAARLAQAAGSLLALAGPPAGVRDALTFWVENIRITQSTLHIRIKSHNSADTPAPVLSTTLAKIRSGNDVRLQLHPTRDLELGGPNGNGTNTTERDPALVALISEAYHAQTLVNANPTLPLPTIAQTSGIGSARFKRLLRINSLAPDIVEAILEGRQPHALTAAKLNSTNIPMLWAAQRTLFGMEGGNGE